MPGLKDRARPRSHAEAAHLPELVFRGHHVQSGHVAGAPGAPERVTELRVCTHTCTWVQSLVHCVCMQAHGLSGPPADCAQTCSLHLTFSEVCDPPPPRAPICASGRGSDTRVLQDPFPQGQGGDLCGGVASGWHVTAAGRHDLDLFSDGWCSVAGRSKPMSAKVPG